MAIVLDLAPRVAPGAEFDGRVVRVSGVEASGLFRGRGGGRIGGRIGFVPRGGRGGARLGGCGGWFSGGRSGLGWGVVWNWGGGGWRVGIRGARQALGLTAAEVAFGSEPIAIGCLVAAEELLEDIGAGGVLKDGSAQGVLGIFLLCHEGLDHPGFETGNTALLPMAADEGVHEFGFDYAFRAELLVVFAGDVQQVVFVFSGDDEGSGIGAVFQGVESG